VWSLIILMPFMPSIQDMSFWNLFIIYNKNLNWNIWKITSTFYSRSPRTLVFIYLKLLHLKYRMTATDVPCHSYADRAQIGSASCHGPKDVDSVFVLQYVVHHSIVAHPLPSVVHHPYGLPLNPAPQPTTPTEHTYEHMSVSKAVVLYTQYTYRRSL